MQNEGPLCLHCPQSANGQRRIETEVHPATYNGILLVGESPWKDEMVAGHPFAGASGFILERWLRKVGLSRQEVAISNTMWCKPPELGWFQTMPSLEALSHCHGYLEQTIEQLKPKVIVALGAVAFKRLTGLSGLVDRRAPRMGYIHPTRYGPVIGCPHPSFIMQGNAALEPYCILALRRAFDVAYERQPMDVWPEVWVDRNPPLPGQLEELMLDIETNYSNEAEDKRGSEGEINRIGAAWWDGQKIVATSHPWNESSQQLIQGLIEHTQTVCFWNQTFDKPRMQKAGNIFPWQTLDAMLVWHFLQPNLPKALGAAAPFFWRGQPWKHLDKENPGFYNALDAWMQLHILREARKSIGPERFHKFEVGPAKVLHILEQSSNIGIEVDLTEQAKLKNAVNEVLLVKQAEINKAVPEEVRPLKVWKRKPSTQPDAFPMEGGGWGLRLPFLVNSPKQVLELAKHLKINLPDTNEKTLARHPHPVLNQVVEIRKLEDTLSNFLMKPHGDGAVHSRFSYFPETWRKSTREPNLQSLPARHPLAEQIRKQLRAREGYAFIAADSAAIEAVIVGWLAKSSRYIRLAKAGVHGWLTSSYQGEPIDLQDPELTIKCKASKKRWPEIYDKCKRVIHLTNYDGTAARMLLEYPGMFASEKEAKKLQNFYLESEPGQDVIKWQHDTVELAQRQGYLETPWGIRNYYTRALVFNQASKKWVKGEQAKEAIAFMPQSMASSIQDLFILALPEHLQRALRLVRHDELLCEVLASQIKADLATLMQVMQMPIPQLGGLDFGAEGKWGFDLNLKENLDAA